MPPGEVARLVDALTRSHLVRRRNPHPVIPHRTTATCLGL